MSWGQNTGAVKKTTLTVKNTNFEKIALNQNKCESPTGDALVPAKKGLQMFVKTIDGHDRITLCVHAHFQAHRVILSWPCIVVTRKSRNLVAKFRTKKVSLSY